MIIRLRDGLPGPVLPTSLFGHPAAELCVDASAGLPAHSASVRLLDLALLLPTVTWARSRRPWATAETADPTTSC